MVVYIEIGEQIRKQNQETNLGKKSGKIVVVSGGYRAASPEPDPAPREAESWEGSWKLFLEPGGDPSKHNFSNISFGSLS